MDKDIRKDFADSLDIDAGLLEGHEQENRWDYLLGYSPTQAVVAVEPHSARTDEITTLIRKKAAAREQLRSHLQDGTRIAVWIWVASGDVQFADTEKAQRRLDEKGIIFARKIITKKVLCTAVWPSPTKPARPQRVSNRWRRLGRRSVQRPAQIAARRPPASRAPSSPHPPFLLELPRIPRGRAPALIWLAPAP
ncbi:MAG: hypothetical protein IPK72_19330 [Candidatus Eisenbacteria bacterium]|nr:hypothetical protein [Candidatus Eisenbacteria bacterium]